MPTWSESVLPGVRDASVQPAIRVRDLGKLYRIGSRKARYDTFRDLLSATLSSPWKRLRSVIRGGSAGSAQRNLWALRKLTFEVWPGEVVGVIGRNGAGKTTLLKVLSRITPPTEGWAEIRGRVSALLEVGTGFHPELTGRENIFLNGAILGMKRSEIHEKFDEIVAFSEVEQFLETPVKYYSSGMYVRLAFAVAAHLEPDIMLVDEVLAVGDAAFQEKCLGKLDSVTRQGRTVLFVSHNMAAIRRLCSRAILLDEGSVSAMGDTEDVVKEYLNSIQASSGTLRDLGQRRGESAPTRLVATGFRALGADGGPARTACPAEFRISYQAPGRLALMRVGLAVKDPLGTTIFVCNSAMTRADFVEMPPRGEVSCRVDWLPLIPGRYWVDLKLMDDRGHTEHVIAAATFAVLDGGESGFFDYPRRYVDGSIIVPHRWEVCEQGEAGGAGDWDSEGLVVEPDGR